MYCLGLPVKLFDAADARTRSSDVHWKRLIEAAEATWTQPYQGEFVALLKEAIERRSLSTYSQVGTIIQSSGTGKSRLVDELAKSVFTIPLNVRQSGDISGESSFQQLQTDVLICL